MDSNALTDIVTDERTARVLLALGGEPTNETTGRLIADLGPTETARLALADNVPAGMDSDVVHAWRRGVSEGMTMPRLVDAAEKTQRVGMEVLIPGDPGWPAGLDDLGHRMPLALWVKGDVLALDGPIANRVAVVGSRASTEYGEKVARDLATDLARRGKGIVSGGAYGIDAAAHRGALAAGSADGVTIAVLPSGLDHPYPVGQRPVFAAIARNGGALVSEHPPGTRIARAHFLARNRLIAALAGATVVVEAAHRGGAMHAAAQAVALGRPLGAVPGPITSVSSGGVHELMKQGRASVITGALDVVGLVETHSTAAAVPKPARTIQAAHAPTAGPHLERPEAPHGPSF